MEICEMLLVSVLPAVVVMTKAQHCCSEWEFNSIFTVFSSFKGFPSLRRST